MSRKLAISALCGLGTVVFVIEAINDVLRMHRLWGRPVDTIANAFILVCHLAFIAAGIYATRRAWK